MTHPRTAKVAQPPVSPPGLSTPHPARRPRAAVANSGAGAESRPADQWIVKFHDSWSRLTLSSFYQDLGDHSITSGQFARWLLDRAAISMALLQAATRVNETLKHAGKSDLPLLGIAKEDAHFLYEFALKQGFDMTSKGQLSHAAKRLVELLEVSTAPDTPFEVAITAIWAYMLSSWAGWALCKERVNVIPKHFEVICNFLERQEAIRDLMRTQIMLNGILTDDEAEADVEKASKTFEEVVRRAAAVLDNTLYIGEAHQIPLCICGRQGHVQSQCTFKSHI